MWINFNDIFGISAVPQTVLVVPKVFCDDFSYWKASWKLTLAWTKSQDTVTTLARRSSKNRTRYVLWLQTSSVMHSMVIIASTYSDINISNFLLYICRLLNHLLTNEWLSMLFSCSDGRHNDRLLITTSSYILVPRRMRTRIPRAAKQCRSWIYYSFKTHVKPFLRPS